MMQTLNKLRKVKTVDLHRTYSAQANYSLWTQRDGYSNCLVSTSGCAENWGEYSDWIERDEYFKNIKVCAGDENWDDYSVWTAQDAYFQSNIKISSEDEEVLFCTAPAAYHIERPASFDDKRCDDSIFAKPESGHELQDVWSTWIHPDIKNFVVKDGWHDYSYWLEKDDYFSLDNWPSFNEESWDESPCLESALEPEAQDVWSTWIQRDIRSFVVVDGWHDYSYWLEKDDYFSLNDWPSFNDKSWDSDHDTSVSSNDALQKVTYNQRSQNIEAFQEDVTSESGFSMTDSNEEIGSSDSEDLQQSIVVPRVGSRQLFGDDFFMQIAHWKYSKKSEGFTTHGTVRCGQSIAEAARRLDDISSMSEKLVICLGAVDVVLGKSADTMITDMRLFVEQLKNKFGYSTKDLTLCTIPPLPNLDDASVTVCKNGYMEQLTFNNWIISLHEEGYQIISFDDIFTQDGWDVNLDLFKRTRQSVDSTFAFQKWNIKGQQKVFRRLLEAQDK